MNYLNLVFLILLTACSGNSGKLPAYKEETHSLDTVQVYLDFYFVNRDIQLKDTCTGKRSFLSTDIRVKQMEKYVFICVLVPDTCLLQGETDIINTLEYNPQGEIRAVKSGTFSFDDPSSFFQHKEHFDSILHQEPVLSSFLRKHMTGK
ncbi:MAG TPA: hypothetical protein VK168_07860 [Saprospiraceae bacterium]|nr:hypothetical protein [Saprospiraceae bacterium]